MTCQRCHGEGRVPNCCDDLCQGDECIHGDYRACPACKGAGFVGNDDYDEEESDE